MATKRLYSVDDSLNLDWVDIDTTQIRAYKKNTAPFFCQVVSAKDGHTDFKFWVAWIWTPENPSGVWHETPQSLAKQLRAKAKEITKFPVHPF